MGRAAIVRSFHCINTQLQPVATMIHPLVTLWRHHARVTFYGGTPGSASAVPSGPSFVPVPGLVGRRLQWASREDATRWLRFWMGQSGAMAELSWLMRHGAQPLAGPRRSAEDALDALAARLMSGDLIAMEESLRLMTPSRLSPAPGTSTAAALSTLPPLSAAVPAVPNPAALLPQLEDVQIEGAQVRPEIEEGLAQVNQSVAQLSQAGASLQPAPSTVADISSTMQASASKAASDLGSL